MKLDGKLAEKFVLKGDITNRVGSKKREENGAMEEVG